MQKKLVRINWETASKCYIYHSIIKMQTIYWDGCHDGLNNCGGHPLWKLILMLRFTQVLSSTFFGFLVLFKIMKRLGYSS